MFGVLTLGAVDAILLAVVLALLRFIRLTSRPEVEILGEVPGVRGYHPLHRNPDATAIPGMLIFRFNAPIVFFNASYFRKRALDAIAAAGPDLRWFVLDAIPVSQIDVTGWHAATELMDELNQRDIRLMIAGRRSQVRGYARNAGLPPDSIEWRLFPTVGTAVISYREQNPNTGALL
jgi:MFS superfamily sulfate permease-like transporter